MNVHKYEKSSFLVKDLTILKKRNKSNNITSKVNTFINTRSWVIAYKPYK